MQVIQAIYDMITSLFSFINVMASSIFSGLEFIFSFFTTIPNFLYESVITQLPYFFQVGLYGVIGVIIFTIVIKIWSHIKI